MKNIILFFLFVFISLNSFSQPCPEPVGEPNQTFCSQTAWALISETDDTLADLKVCGSNLTWYADANGTNVLPNTTVLVTGTTYYVSQTINGCESPLLAITVTVKDCGCIKNPGFQTHQGASNLNGYTFLQQTYSSQSNPSWCCNINTVGGNGLQAATPYTPGPVNSMAHEVVPVTPGFDPTLQALSILLPRTSPYATCSSNAVRLNRNGVSPAKITSMRKKFVAGEVISFDYAIVLESAFPGDEDPFFQIKIYDKNDELVQSQCIRVVQGECIFNSFQTSSSIFYTDWSCFQFDTSLISGQEATIEFSIADSSLSGHYAYVYIDSLYAGDYVSSNCFPQYGYAGIASVNAPNSVDYNVCSMFSQPISQGCVVSVTQYNTLFPIEFCVTYSMPFTANSSTISASSWITSIYKEGALVGNSTFLVSASGNNFCKSVTAGDISVPLYGSFYILSQMAVQIDCSTPYNLYLETPKYNFKVCPIAGCPLPLTGCSPQPGSGIGTFDLTQAIPEIKGTMNPNDVVVSYYETAADAEAGVNAIANPQNYQNTTPNTQLVYARLDVDWVNLAVTPEDDCFDVVEMELNVVYVPVLAPVGEPNQTFCSQTAWAFISETEDTLADLKVCGANLTWYDDASGTTVLPDTTVLVTGTTYYVSQTVNGCEGPLLAITVTDKDCGCIKNPGFQTNQGSSSLNGFTFLQQQYTQNFTPLWSCNVNTDGGNGLQAATPYTPGPENSMVHDAVLVTPGNDPTLNALSIALPRTSPFAACSSQAVRLNRENTSADIGAGKITSMRKEFIAGEVFSFDYAIVSHGTNHTTLSQQPFLQIKIYDENNTLIQSQCIITNRDDCFFNLATLTPQRVIYSDWTCFQFDTSSISGQAATVEFSAADCSVTGHYTYVYIDNLYVGDAATSSCIYPLYGFATITSVNAPNALDYDVCSMLAQPTHQGCIVSSELYNIQFPVEICGILNVPAGTTSSTLTTTIYKDGVLVGNSSSLVTTWPNSFCATVNSSDITVPSYGIFSVQSHIDMQLNCSVPYSLNLETPLYDFKVCPIAGCPLPLTGCSPQPGSGIGTFDLTQAIPEIKGTMNPNDVVVSFYETAADAEAGVNAIANPQNYQNTTPNTQLIYARLDVDWVTLTMTPENDCYDVIEMELNVEDSPVITDAANLNPLIVPDPNNTGSGVFDLTVQIPNIIGALTNVDVTFYESQVDAANEQNPIADPENYTGIHGQVIYVNVKDVDNNCFNTTSFELHLDTSMSVEDSEEGILIMYPNPAEKILYFQSNQLGSDVLLNVYGVQGNLLYSDIKLAPGQLFDLNVSQWASGVYFVTVTSDNAVTVRKFVKK